LTDFLEHLEKRPKYSDFSYNRSYFSNCMLQNFITTGFWSLFERFSLYPFKHIRVQNVIPVNNRLHLTEQYCRGPDTGIEKKILTTRSRCTTVPGLGFRNIGVSILKLETCFRELITVKLLIKVFELHLKVHRRRRSSVFGNARFWFLPKPNQILPKFCTIYSNLLKFYPNLPKFCLNFTQICLNLLGECGHHCKSVLI